MSIAEKYMSMVLGMAALAPSAGDTHYAGERIKHPRHSTYTKSELAAIKKRRKKNKNKKTHRK